MTNAERGYRRTGSSRSTIQRILFTILLLATMMKRCSAVYAVYDIPPCTIILETTAVDSLSTPQADGLLSETLGHNSGLSYPLKDATQSFLFDQFQRKIEELEVQALGEDSTMLFAWFPMYAHFQLIELEVQFFLVEITGEEDEENTRHLQSSLRTATLRVEITGELYFEEPSDIESKPSYDQVNLMFGQWMESIFATQRGSYTNALMAENQDVLTQSVIVDITTQLPSKVTYGRDNGLNGIGTMTQDRTQRILLSLLLLVCSVGFIFSIYALRRQRYKYAVRQMMHAHLDGGASGGYLDGDDGEYNFSGSIREPTDGMDAMRHGSDIIYAHRSAQSVLENTDRYLSKHRPDLYSSDPNHDQISLSSRSSTTGSNISVFGREYTIPSNPFEVLYSAFNQESKFEVSPQGAFTPRQQNSVFEEQQTNNLAAAGMEDDDTTTNHGSSTTSGGGDPALGTMGSRSREFEDEHYYEDDVGGFSFSPHKTTMPFRPISSIWRNITNMVWDPERRENQDGIVMEEYTKDLELQSGQFQYHDDAYPLDEPPDYDFPFKDFPRHDGTPCLIFNDNGAILTPRQREAFAIGSPPISPKNREDNARDTMPVSDEAFQRMLAAQGADTRAISPDDSLFLEPSFASFTSSDDVIADPKTTDMSSSAAVPTQFKADLARLYEQKFRQYEKKAIVEKHQERREKERKSQREQERRERHKLMEGTIEDLEGDIGTATRWQASQASPNPYHYSPKQHTRGHSPKTKYSPYRTGHHHSDNISRASPSTRKMMEWDRELADGSASTAMGSGILGQSSSSSSLRGMADEPFRMRPRTVQPLGGGGGGIAASTDMNFSSTTSYLPASSSIDHSTLDKLSLPHMTATTKKYSPNAVMDDIFGSAPTSISTRKNNNSNHNSSTTGSTAPPNRGDGNSMAPHRRGNSLDHNHKAILGLERPLPQQRRRPKAGTAAAPRTRSRTPTRALTPTRIGYQQSRQQPMNYSSQHNHSSGGDLSFVGGGGGTGGGGGGGTNVVPRRRRSASPAPRGEHVFTHGIVAHTRIV